MINTIYEETRTRMQKSLDSMQVELGRLHTGRVSVSLVDHLKVACYEGNPMPLNQLASIVVEDATTLTISPWDKAVIPAVEKALINSKLGLMPNTAGAVIRVVMPPLSEERRKSLVAVVREMGENACVAVRNIRRDANRDIKNLVKEKEISEDDQKRAEAEIQKITDRFISDITKALKAKEEELITV